FINNLLKHGKTEISSNELKRLNDTLDRYLGKVPATFWYKMKQYNPRTFADEVVHFADDYIAVASFADQPLYKQFILQDKFNWANDSFYNVTLNEMQMLTDTALARGWSIGWEGDVTEPGFNSYGGFASIPDTIHRYDEERLINYRNESTERDHMMHIVGAGRDEKNRKWYHLKNSWGQWFSRYKGYLYMDENYLKLKTVIVMVNKEALPEKLKDKLGLK
ncbi:MAG TPA: C1 family peptidase, partial [Chitinophagaceae bacterium]|nr:C1 family peptidase [Chitinophagaceae bacterium]